MESNNIAAAKRPATIYALLFTEDEVVLPEFGEPDDEGPDGEGGDRVAAGAGGPPVGTAGAGGPPAGTAGAGGAPAGTAGAGGVPVGTDGDGGPPVGTAGAAGPPVGTAGDGGPPAGTAGGGKNTVGGGLLFPVASEVVFLGSDCDGSVAVADGLKSVDGSGNESGVFVGAGDSGGSEERDGGGD